MIHDDMPERPPSLIQEKPDIREQFLASFDSALASHQKLLDAYQGVCWKFGGKDQVLDVDMKNLCQISKQTLSQLGGDLDRMSEPALATMKPLVETYTEELDKRRPKPSAPRSINREAASVVLRKHDKLFKFLLRVFALVPGPHRLNSILMKTLEQTLEQDKELPTPQPASYLLDALAQAYGKRFSTPETPKDPRSGKFLEPDEPPEWSLTPADHTLLSHSLTQAQSSHTFLKDQEVKFEQFLISEAKRKEEERLEEEKRKQEEREREWKLAIAEGRIPKEYVRLIQSEQKRLQEFFGKPIEVPPIPPEITQELLSFWNKNHFQLEFEPAIDMTENNNFPGWQHKPGKKYTPGKQYGIEFYKEAQEIQNLRENQNNPNLQGLKVTELPGSWALKDTRDKPNYQNGDQEYKDDKLIQGVIRALVSQGIINPEASKGLRNNIHPNVFKKTEFWQAFRSALRLPENAIIRLPRVIESNVMGQAKGFHDTSTHEWCEEEIQSGGRLILGSSDYGGASYVGWSVSAVGDVGFRPLVVFPQS